MFTLKAVCEAFTAHGVTETSVKKVLTNEGWKNSAGVVSFDMESFLEWAMQSDECFDYGSTVKGNCHRGIKKFARAVREWCKTAASIPVDEQEQSLMTLITSPPATVLGSLATIPQTPPQGEALANGCLMNRFQRDDIRRTRQCQMMTICMERTMSL